MIKPHSLHLPAAQALIVAALLVSACSTSMQQGQVPTAASVDLDCAPWDGPAFTVSIPQGSQGKLLISIWQAPEIGSRVSFSFPDETGRVGNAVYLAASGDFQTLRGTVSLDRALRDVPVEGAFDLSSDDGVKFSGRFQAAWGTHRPMCG